jgi:hypothetical protein
MAAMENSEKLKLAGLAADFLEQMGFVAVARLRAGVVLLEFWKGPVAMRYELSSAPLSARALADACAAEYTARTGDREA